MTRPANAVSFGPRLRRLVRLLAGLVNPLVMLIAGRRWMPVVGILHHSGRRSGRAHATPLGMRPLSGGFFVMPRTFGESAGWYLNVRAVGRAVATYGGLDHALVEPEIVDFQTAAPAFPRYERLQFRLLGIKEFVRLREVGLSPALPRESTRGPKGAVKPAPLADGGPGRTTTTRNLNLALAVIAVAQLMVVLDVAIVNVALPSIQRALKFGATDLEWVVNAYAIAFGGLLLLGGRTGDLFGRRRMFMTGTFIFTLGSLAGGLAASPTMLILARAVQGAGGAVVAPTALSLLADTFPEGAARNRALGIYSAVSAAGGAIGLLLGGVITTYLSWRWILFVNVPVGAILMAATPRVLAALKGRPGRLDLPGAALVTAGATLLVYSLSRAAAHGWGDRLTLTTLIAGAVLLVAFVAVEAVSDQPLMPLAIFRNRNRSAAYAVSLTNGATLSGLLFLVTLYLQNVQGLSPLQAGFAFLPTAMGVFVGAGTTSRLIGRIGPRVPMTFGTLLVAAGVFWLANITAGANYFAHVLGPLVVLAIGLGQVFVSTSVVAVSGVRPQESGLASALLNVGRQLGGSLGIAIMGTVAATVTADQMNGLAATHAAAASALTAGFRAAFVLGGLMAAAGFVTALAAVRHEPERAPAEVRESAA